MMGDTVLKSVLSHHVAAFGQALIERSPYSQNKGKHGRLDNYLPVHIIDFKPEIGEFLEVQVVDTFGDMLIAQPHSGE